MGRAAGRAAPVAQAGDDFEHHATGAAHHAVKLFLDTGVLGQICHPRKHADVQAWFGDVIRVHEVVVPEIADYELRRELLRIGATRSLARLDELVRELEYAPITTSTWRRAAALWADRRRSGRPTAAQNAIDGDVILAALALTDGGTVVTTNAKDFVGLVAAVAWRDVPSR